MLNSKTTDFLTLKILNSAGYLPALLQYSVHRQSKGNVAVQVFIALSCACDFNSFECYFILLQGTLYQGDDRHRVHSTVGSPYFAVHLGVVLRRSHL